eukprot:4083802-Alexandrium_andersonii.AAC.1
MPSAVGRTAGGGDPPKRLERFGGPPSHFVPIMEGVEAAPKGGPNRVRDPPPATSGGVCGVLCVFCVVGLCCPWVRSVLPPFRVVGPLAGGLPARAWLLWPLLELVLRALGTAKGCGAPFRALGA